MELLMRKINKQFYISVDAADVVAHVKVNAVVVVIIHTLFGVLRLISRPFITRNGREKKKYERNLDVQKHNGGDKIAQFTKWQKKKCMQIIINSA